MSTNKRDMIIHFIVTIEDSISQKGFPEDVIPRFQRRGKRKTKGLTIVLSGYSHARIV
jgi:hypothetical protein